MIRIESAKLPKVSIIVPCYNHENYIQETIQSIINQDYKNIELIIIDDGSLDSSVKAIQEMIPKCEARFSRFEFRSRENKGLCMTLNEALEWCQGEFLAGVASDDTLKKYKTSLQVNYLIKNTVSIGVFGELEFFYEDTNVRTTISTPDRKYNFDQIFLHKHRLPASTSLLRIENIRELGGYKEAFLLEDWSLWLFLTQNGGTLDYIDVVLGVYRRHQTNISLQLDRMLKGRIEIANIFNSHLLYKKALSRIYFISAREYQSTNRIKTFKYLAKSISHDYIFSLNIAKYYIELIFLKFRYIFNKST